ncbi:MAG: Uncharacterised protein [SAR116 cluster bacterium MED-G04]|nr:MAG: Uncharacterised protein [SAR116 cluster bacterium MED-G04]
MTMLAFEVLRTADGGVGDNQARTTPFHGHPDSGFQPGPVQIRGQFQHHRTDRACGRHAFTGGIQHLGQEFGFLQAAQPRCVGGGNIHRQVISKRRQPPGAGMVILHPVRAVLVGADIHAQNAFAMVALPEPGEPTGGGFHAAVVEPVAVDDSVIPAQPKHPWFGVARLRLGGDGADFDHPETKPECALHGLGILVEPGRKAKRVGKIHSRNRCVESIPEMIRGAFRAKAMGQCLHRKPMRRLTREALRQAPGEAPDHPCAPSAGPAASAPESASAIRARVSSRP